MRRRRGFTLLELVVVVMIVGILAGIAAPRFLNIRSDATDNETWQSLSVLRDGIERYAAQNAGKYPTGDEATIKMELMQYFRGPFPKCPVGDATEADTLTIGTDNPLAADGKGGWMYNTTTGEIIINCTDTSEDDRTTYDKF